MNSIKRIMFGISKETPFQAQVKHQVHQQNNNQKEEDEEKKQQEEDEKLEEDFQNQNRHDDSNSTTIQKQENSIQNENCNAIEIEKDQMKSK